MADADTGSLIISYLWSRRGQALIAEFAMAPQFAGRADINVAVNQLVGNGYVDRVEDELPSVRLTPEAVAAINTHLSTGAALPEKILRAAEREAMARDASAASQVEMVRLMREMREERQIMMDTLQRHGLLANNQAPRQLEAAPLCQCGGLYFPDVVEGKCGRCGKEKK